MDARPQFISPCVPNNSCSSSPSDRRLTTLAAHFVQASSSAMANSITVSPTFAIANSIFAHVVHAPEGPILGVALAYNKDPSPVKLNLGVGAYRTEVSVMELGFCILFICYKPE